LRTLADSRAIIERTKTAKRVVVIGGSFIGLDGGCATTRGIGCRRCSQCGHRPVMGRGIFNAVRALHGNGVVFHLENTARSIDEKVTLASGAGSPPI
jgi:hypothetical protein